MREVRDGFRAPPDRPTMPADPRWMVQVDWAHLLREQALERPMKEIWQQQAQVLTSLETAIEGSREVRMRSRRPANWTSATFLRGVMPPIPASSRLTVIHTAKPLTPSQSPKGPTAGSFQTRGSLRRQGKTHKAYRDAGDAYQVGPKCRNQVGPKRAILQKACNAFPKWLRRNFQRDFLTSDVLLMQQLGIHWCHCNAPAPPNPTPP